MKFRLLVGYAWHFGVVWRNLPYLLGGLKLTLLVTVISMVIGSSLGTLVAIMRLSRMRAVRTIATVYTDFLRSLPALMLLVWIYTALPLVTGLILPPFVSGVTALSLNCSAYIAEVVRSGLTSLSRGQEEAGLALGMRRTQVYRRVLLPQAIRRMIPPFGTIWVSLFKDTSLVSVISVSEIMYRTKVLSTETFRPLEVFTAGAVLYFIITYPQARLVNWSQKKLLVDE